MSPEAKAVPLSKKPGIILKAAKNMLTVGLSFLRSLMASARGETDHAILWLYLHQRYIRIFTSSLDMLSLLRDHVRK